MPYARRNARGEIESLHRVPTPEASELVHADSDAVRRFLGASPAVSGAEAAYRAHDDDFVRVLEDLIDLLAAKGLVAIGELPVAVQAKYLARKEHRQGRTGDGGSMFGSGFVTIIDDSAFGQLGELAPPPSERGPRS